LKKKKLWKEALRTQMYDEAMEEVGAAAKIAETTARPGLETIFSDVYAELPPHLRRQGQESFDLAKRKGDAAAGEGAFPL
jgi:TPP-dependent pyruvate/acetoin dehydrogenase alpha subunit